MVDDPKLAHYETEIEKINARLKPEIENHGRAAYEYGVLIQKHLFYLYGGSLIIIPPLLQASSTFTVSEAFQSAILIFLSIVLLNICTYIVHLNWNFNLSSSLHERNLEHWRMIERVWGPSDQSLQAIAEIKEKLIRIERKIKITFYLPHFFGLSSLASYVVGGWLMIEAFATK